MKYSLFTLKIPPILKITIPRQGYTKEDRKGIDEMVKKQVGKYYIPIILPKDIELEVLE